MPQKDVSESNSVIKKELIRADVYNNAEKYNICIFFIE